MEIQKTAIVIVHGVNGRNLRLIDELSERMGRHGSVTILNQKGSVKNRAETLERSVEELHQQGKSIILVGHSLGGYIIPQANFGRVKPAAVIRISTPPTAAPLSQNIREAQMWLDRLGPGQTTAKKAFNEAALMKNYDRRARTLQVPTLHVRMDGDPLSMPGHWERKRKANSGDLHAFVVIGKTDGPLEKTAEGARTVFNRHNWKDEPARNELMDLIDDFLKKHAVSS